MLANPSRTFLPHSLNGVSYLHHNQYPMTTMKNHLISNQAWKRLLLPALVAGSLLALPNSTRATLPNTGSGNLTVIFGTATYPALTTGATGALNITATSANTVLGWTDFSDSGALGAPATGGTMATGDLINFILPTSTSAVLNQVTGGFATTIGGGTIASNGKVFILNPAGIAFSTGAAINAAAFYASTVPETLSYFETNGSLQVFNAAAPATTTAGSVTVNAGVQLSTIGGNGTIGFAGNSVTVAGGNAVTGNLYLESQGGPISVSQGAGGLTIGITSAGGNLTIGSNGGAIDLANGGATTITGTLTATSTGASGNGAITDTNAFSASTAGTTSTVNAGTGSSGGIVTLNQGDFASIGIIGKSVVINDPTANTIALGTSTINGTLSVTSALGSISNTGAVAASGNISLTAPTAGKTITFSTSGNVSFGAVTTLGGGASAVTITGTGNLKFTAGINSPTVTITTTGGTYTDAGISATTATISASGNASLAASTVPTITVTSGNTILQTGALTSATKATFNAPTIALSNAGNNIANLIMTGGGAAATAPAFSVTVVDTAPTLILGTGTNVTGTASITNAGNIQIGAASADVVGFGSSLTLVATGGGAITTTSTNVAANGTVTATTTNAPITLGLAGSTNTSFGQIGGASGTGAFTINESATTNLGPLVTSGVLTVVSGGSIINNGGSAAIVNASGGVALSAGTVAAPQSITLGAAGSGNGAVIPGTITLNIASGFTMWDLPAAAVTVSTGANTVASESIFINDGSNLTVNGASGFGTLSFKTGAGAVTVTDPTALVLTNAIDSGAGSTAITTTAGSITLGSGIVLAGSGLNTLTANGTGGLVTDTASSPVQIAGNLTVSAKAITLNNNTANSVGQVNLSSVGSIAYTEGSTVNIGAILATGTSGTVSVSSVSGSIIQAGAITIPAGYTAANFSAPTGAVTLNFASNLINKSALIGLTAGGASGTAGNSTIDNTLQTTLGNITVPLATLTVSTLGSGFSISQGTGTSIFEFGAGSFTTNGAAITLANAGNNFGALSIDTTFIVAGVPTTAAGAAVSVRESGTNNYSVVTAGTAGTLTAVDDLASIIESGSGAGTGIFAAGGSFTASSGAVTLTNALNNFGGAAVKITTGTGNASLTDVNATTVLADGTSVGGSLTVTNSNTNGVIRDAGSSSTITVTGLFAALAATGGTGDLVFTGSNSTFGSIELQGGSGATQLLDNTSMILAPSSHVVGPTSLTSAGNITTSGVGGSSFGNTLSLVASGSIVITNPINVVGVLTVDAIAGPTNLSFLSKTANLNGLTTVNAGNASNYTGPSP
jgi:fibronectin-binding autotransporter adhesin